MGLRSYLINHLPIMSTLQPHRIITTAAALAIFALLLTTTTSAWAATGSASLEAEAEVETELERAVVGQSFVLDGSRSQDDGVVRTFMWWQVSGPVVALSSKSTAKPTFTPQAPGTYVFELVVTDSAGLRSNIKQITVEVAASIGTGSAGIVQNNQTNLEFVRQRASGGSEVEDEASDDASTGAKPDDDSQDDADDDSDEVNPVAVSKVTVRGWDPKKKEEFLSTVKDWAELKSGQDLENFATGVLIKDQNVESISMNFEKIKVDYKMPAKFLGLFNASLTAHTEVDTDSRVKVKFPWLAFLYTKPASAAIEQGVTAGLKQVMQTQVRTAGDGSESAITELQNALQKTAQTLQTMSSVMKAMHDSAKSIIQNIRA